MADSVDEDFRRDTGAWWPVGDYDAPYERLADLLVDASALHARRAILQRRSSARLDLMDAAVSAGAAVELLAKACVATVDPVLLAAAPAGGGRGGSLAASVHHLRGHEAHRGPSPISDVTTISVTAAIALAADLHRPVTAAPKKFGPLLDVRNAAAHMGLVDDDKLQEAVRLMAQFVEQALIALDLDREDFWSPQIMRVVDGLLAARRDEISQVAHELIAQAAATYKERSRQLGAEQFRALVEMAEARALDTELVTVNHPCPACDNVGSVLVSHESEYERVGEDEYDVTHYSYAAGFACPVCGLNLDSEMLDPAGIDYLDAIH